MKVLQFLLNAIVGLVDLVFPVFNVPDSFYTQVNNAVVTFVGILRAGAYFVPLDVLVICLGIIIVVDNYALLVKVGQYILKLIRG